MTTATALPSALPYAPRRSRTLRRVREVGVYVLLIACGTFSVCTTGAIIAILAVETVEFFQLEGTSIGDFLIGLKWQPLLGSEKFFGIWPLIVGTLLVTVIAMGFALPLGLITAIYLSEYAPARIRNALKPTLEVIAGVPTVVFGYFALTVITPGLQWLHDGFGVYNAMSAGLAVGIMCLPIVTSLAEDALRAVPTNLREAAYGLGGTRLEVSLRVVVPAALSGIIAAFLLAIARAVGETMIVALAAGASALPLYENLASGIDPRSEVLTMTGYMVMIFFGDTSSFGVEYYSAYAVAATLFVMTFALTLIGHRVRVRFRQTYE